MEVARRLVWQFLVDDPVLFFRTILEQFTKKDKQVSEMFIPLGFRSWPVNLRQSFVAWRSF